jgi:hypothetical protein
MTELRLIDPDGYSVPGGTRTTTPETDTQVRAQLNQLAAEHAAQWADFGYHTRLYQVVPARSSHTEQPDAPSGH